VQFNQIRQEIKNVPCDSLRLDCDNHFEAVIPRQEIGNLTHRLESFFGAPVWPSRDGLAFSIEEKIKSYGGIMPGQTLYYWAHGQDTIFAMLWPWQDGVRTTVKIVQK
jgi:hypothetical protein